MPAAAASVVQYGHEMIGSEGGGSCQALNEDVNIFITWTESGTLS